MTTAHKFISGAAGARGLGTQRMFKFGATLAVVLLLNAQAAAQIGQVSAPLGLPQL